MISEELIDHLPDIFFTADANHCIVSISLCASSLLGYRHQQLLGRRLDSLFVEPACYLQLRQAVDTAAGAMVSTEAQVQCQDGRYVWLQFNLRTCIDETGGCQGLEGVARDINEQRALLKQVRDSEDRFRRLSDLARESVFIHHQGRLLDCNQAAQQLFGYSHAEMMRMQAFDLVARADVATVRHNIEQQTEQPYVVNGRRVDNTTFPMEIHSRQSVMGALPVRVTCIRDLSEQYQMQHRTRMLSEAIENCPVAVIIADAAGRVEYINPAVVEMTGYVFDDLRALPLLGDLFCLEIDPAAKWLRWKLTMGQPWSGRLKLRRADGEVICVIARLSATTADNGDVMHQSLVLEDITLQENHEQTIRHQANYDALTGLPNRSMAAERMQQMLVAARETETQAAMLFVDLDEFKSINDTLGHDYGDALLQAVAERLQLSVEKEHCLARFGGDEFLLMVAGLRASMEVEALCERLLQAFSRPFRIRDRELTVSISLGVAVYPLDGSDFTTLLRHADTAMYQAKQGGKNGYCFFNSQMNQQAEQRLQIESQLRWVLERNELSLNYQPVIDFATGQLRGVEALLRWHSPEMGVVTPDQFIPVAESSGMIVAIGNWVMQMACLQAKRWQDQFGIPLRMAVNVSPRQFKGGDLVEMVSQALADSGLAPECLEIEVTEGLLMRHRTETRKTFRELQAMGVRIAIDDFGTGYSSLAYLEKFSFNTLKIDKSFVAGMAPDSRRDTLVQTIITMAHGLDLKVVAEGVETAEQVARLSVLDCDFAQGYHYSKPLTAVDFAHYITRHCQLESVLA